MLKTNRSIWIIAVFYFAAGFLCTYGEIICEVFRVHDVSVCTVAKLANGAAPAAFFLANLIVFGLALLIGIFSKSRRRPALIFCLLTVVLAELFLSYRSNREKINALTTSASEVVSPSTYPLEFMIYSKELQSHIKKNWIRKDTRVTLVTQVSIEIESDGTLKNVSIQKSSGDIQFDQAVLLATRQSSPVPAPPSSVYERFKSVVLTFDSRE